MIQGTLTPLSPLHTPARKLTAFLYMLGDRQFFQCPSGLYL